MVDLRTRTEKPVDTALRPGRLGVLGVVFFVVAGAAPLVGMTGGLPLAIVAGNGAAAPGAFVAVGLVLAVFSVGYAAMAGQVTNTGAFFAYVGRGLGVIPGVGAAFTSLVAYLAVLLGLFGFFGAIASAQMNAAWGLDLPWYVWAFLAWSVVTALSLLSIDVGARVLGILMGLELLSLFVTAAAVMLSETPEGLDFAASFAPQNIFAGGLAGTAGIALAMAFASFIGFEATAIYGEESKDPHRTVPRATYLALATITTIFGFTAFAVVTGLGASKVVDGSLEYSENLANPAGVLFAVTEQYVGSGMVTVMEWLVISSLFAGLLAFQNSASRYVFALGRFGVLPSRLERVNERGAPWIAALATSALTGAVIVLFWVTGRDPVLNLFYWFSGLAVLSIVFVEILVSLAVVAYFARDRRGVSLWASLIAPLLAAGGLALGLWLLASRFGLLSGAVKEGVDPTTQTWSLNATGWTLVLTPIAAFALGALIGWLRRDDERRAGLADLVT